MWDTSQKEFKSGLQKKLDQENKNIFIFYSSLIYPAGIILSFTSVMWVKV